jgi:hypothetical protein
MRHIAHSRRRRPQLRRTGQNRTEREEEEEEEGGYLQQGHKGEISISVQMQNHIAMDDSQKTIGSDRRERIVTAK